MILDLFAGPGGWSEGLRSIGLHDVGIEWDASACATRTAAGHLTIRADVAQYPVEPFVGRVRGLIASPPCQAWSMAGKGAGRKEIEHIHRAVEACRGGWVADEHPWEDERTRLILEPLRWAWALRPLWVACEQVPPGMPVWEHMADVLRSWGYDATAVLLSSEQYGVPQTRERAFLLAHRERVRVPAPTHQKYVKGVAAGAAPECSDGLFGPGVKPWVSMAEVLGWWGVLRYRRGAGMTERHGERPDRADSEPAFALPSSAPRTWHIHEEAPDAYETRYGGFSGQDQVTPIDKPAPTLTVSGLAKGRDRWAYLRSSNQDHAARRAADEPAPTLAFGHAMNEVGFVAEPDERVNRTGRAITLQEAAVLQGFRADYPFQGKRSKTFEQVGNVVPPLVAAAIVGALDADYIREHARRAA